MFKEKVREILTEIYYLGYRSGQCYESEEQEDTDNPKDIELKFVQLLYLIESDLLPKEMKWEIGYQHQDCVDAEQRGFNQCLHEIKEKLAKSDTPEQAKLPEKLDFDKLNIARINPEKRKFIQELQMTLNIIRDKLNDLIDYLNQKAGGK